MIECSPITRWNESSDQVNTILILPILEIHCWPLPVPLMAFLYRDIMNLEDYIYVFVLISTYLQEHILKLYGSTL